MDRPSDEAQQDEIGWFSVRCVLRAGSGPAGQSSGPAGQSYEERLTLWRVGGFDQAIASAEAEAREYAAEQPGMTFVGLAQAYRLFDEPAHGAEVFSLIRESGLDPPAYLTRFFDTGGERQAGVAPGV